MIRLKLSVNNALPMEEADKLRQLCDQPERLRDRVRLANEFGGQAALRDVLDSQIRHAIPPAGAVDGHNVRVRDRCPQISRLPKSSLPFLAGARIGREDLEGYGLLERAGLSQINGAPGAAADLVDQLV